MKKIIFLIVIFITSLIKPQNNNYTECNCFLLVEQNDILSIEKIFVDNNTVQVVNDKKVISVILSWGEGMSGDMIKKEEREGMFIVQCKEGVLKVKHRSKDGSEKSLPDVNVDKLKNLDIRVNVTGSNVIKKAFVIKNFNTVVNDDGPVLNMFGGKALIPVFNIGTIDVINTNVSVLESFPQKLEELGVAGILGLDIIEQSSKIKIIGINNSETKTVTFNGEDNDIALEFTLPIKKAGGLFFTDGLINSYQVEFVIDLGARETILSKPLFEKMNDRSFSVIDRGKTITGIDGKPSNAFVISVSEFQLSNYKFENQQIVISDIAVLQSYGLQNTSALLGMNFFNRFDAIEIDLGNKT